MFARVNSPTFITPALGTPASGVATNLTGTAAGLTAGTVTTNANLTGPITSVGNATSVAAQTGTGSTFVMQTSPTLTTPALGVASATSINFGQDAFNYYDEGTFTPTLTFATPGDLSVVYSSRVGIYTRIGRVVTISFQIITSTFTHTTASGALQITGAPFTSGSTQAWSNALGNFQGFTKANYTQVGSQIGASATTLTFPVSGSGQATGDSNTGDWPSGGTVILRGTLTYNV